MHCNNSENHTTFCQRIDHKCCYEAKRIKQASYVWWRTVALSIVAGKLSNYCYLLVIASNGTTGDINQNLYCNTYWQEYSRKYCKWHWWLETYYKWSVAVTDWFSLHNSIYGLQVNRKLCDSCQYFSALLLLAYHQVAYELCFIVLFL